MRRDWIACMRYIPIANSRKFSAPRSVTSTSFLHVQYIILYIKLNFRKEFFDQPTVYSIVRHRNDLMSCRSPLQCLLIDGQRYISRRETRTPRTIQKTIKRTRWIELPSKTAYIIMVDWWKSSNWESFKGRERTSWYERMSGLLGNDAEAPDAHSVNKVSSSASPACAHPMRRIAAANSYMERSPLAFSSAMFHISRRIGYDKPLRLKTSIAASGLSAPSRWQSDRRRIWLAKIISSSEGEKPFNDIGRKKECAGTFLECFVVLLTDGYPLQHS